MISCGLTAGLTIYWYTAYDENSDWNGGGMDFVLLAFALTAPISAAMTMAFNRRERALITIADFRSWSYHLYLAHSLWDWSEKGGRAGATNVDGTPVDWVAHCDAVMAQLVGVGDELSRFLSLPTTSRSRHRMTKQGRREAARTVEVAYQLLESTATQRLTRLVMYSERIKKIGLPSGELSRIRQYERFLSSMVEQLRMIKMYRTPQAFRSFARIFTLVRLATVFSSPCLHLLKVLFFDGHPSHLYSHPHSYPALLFRSFPAITLFSSHQLLPGITTFLRTHVCSSGNGCKFARGRNRLWYHHCTGTHVRICVLKRLA